MHHVSGYNVRKVHLIEWTIARRSVVPRGLGDSPCAHAYIYKSITSNVYIVYIQMYLYVRYIRKANAYINKPEALKRGCVRVESPSSAD